MLNQPALTFSSGEDPYSMAPPSLREARYLGVNGDWTFEAGVRVIGEVTLDDRGAPQMIAAGSTLTAPSPASDGR